MSEIQEIYEAVKALWNRDADEYNQWDDLGEDEKIAFAVAHGKRLQALDELTRLGQEMGDYD